MKLEDFLDYMKNDITRMIDSGKYDILKAQHENFIATLEYYREYSRSCDKHKEHLTELVVEYSRTSLKALALINAGGIFVIMTIVSGLLGKDSNLQPIIPSIANSASSFVWGLSCAVLTILLAYLSEWCNHNRHKECVCRFLNWSAIVAGAASFACFLWGTKEFSSVFTSEYFVSLIGSGKSCGN